MKKYKREQAYRAWQYWKLFPNEPLRKIAALHNIAYSTLSNYIRDKMDIYYCPTKKAINKYKMINL